MMKRRVARKVLKESLCDRRHRKGTVLRAYLKDRIGAVAYVMTMIRFHARSVGGDLLSTQDDVRN